ncbi:MAG: cyclic nucleotide-binding domain-containing protein [Chloroflexota bacterium]|nr:cyclic nucleotide-binding domain-containing protein [Chloroflexota bacterium]
MYEDTLSRVDLFHNLNKKELQALARVCKEQQYSAGTTVISEGTTGVGLYILTKGEVRITQGDKQLNTAGAGEVLGEMSLLDDLPRSATVTAVDDVTALLLPSWEFRVTVKDHPDIALKLLSVLSKRLRKAQSRPQE